MNNCEIVMSDVVTLNFSHRSLKTLEDILLKVVDTQKISEPRRSLLESEAKATKNTAIHIAEKLLEEYGSSVNNELRNRKNYANQARKKKKIVILNLGYNSLTEIDGIAHIWNKLGEDPCEKLQWLDLQHNRISFLPPCLSCFTQLTVLYLQGNNIFDLNTFSELTKLQGLKNLTVHANPIVNIPNFRLFLIKLLPQLRKLDWTLITAKERIDATVYIRGEGASKRLPVYTEEVSGKKSPSG